MKALKAKRKKSSKYKPEATPSTTIFRKGSVASKDDLTALSVSVEPSSPPQEDPGLGKSHDSLGDFRDVSGRGSSPVAISA